MTRFLKERIWDMALCTVLLFACGTCVFSGFYVPEEQAGAYGVTLIASALLVLLMSIASYDKRSLIIGIGALLLLFAGMIVYSAGSGNSVFADDESNGSLWLLLLILTGICIFAATRFRLGTVLLFPAGTITLCMIEFLYETRHVACLLLFLVAAVTMIIYRNYMNNVLHSRTLKTAQTSAILWSLVLCLAVAGLGTGIYYGIVQPLHPKAKELKLITKYMSLEVMERIGIADIETINDPNLMTDRQNDETDTTKDESDEKDDTLNDGVSESGLDDGEGVSPDQLDKRRKGPFYAIRYDWGIPMWALILALLLLLFAAAVFTKLQLRRRWFRKVRANPPEQQVREMYAFFLKKLRQLKIRPVRGETPRVFAARTAEQLHAFQSPHGNFADLTDVIVRTEYAGQVPTFDDITLFESFYGCFYRNCREHLGRVQYMIKFFIL